MQNLRLEDKGRFGVFIQKYGMQFLLQGIFLVIAITTLYVGVTKSIENILKEHEAMAQEIKTLKTETGGLDVITTEITSLSGDVKDIKGSQLRLEDKFDNYVTRGQNFSPIK